MANIFLFAPRVRCLQTVFITFMNIYKWKLWNQQAKTENVDCWLSHPSHFEILNFASNRTCNQDTMRRNFFLILLFMVILWWSELRCTIPGFNTLLAFQSFNHQELVSQHTYIKKKERNILMGIFCLIIACVSDAAYIQLRTLLRS